MWIKGQFTPEAQGLKLNQTIQRQMLHKMPGQHGDLKPRKRKSSSELKSSRKGTATRRKCIESIKTHSAAENPSVVHDYSGADSPQERLSRISCECMLTAGRRRCLASPELGGQEGKENELRTGLDMDSCRINSSFNKQESEEMECEDSVRTMFPDDDSNQILPVEQFFGNLDAVQDFPQRLPESSARARRKNRRRQYYALEDSDEEEVNFSSEQQEDIGTTQ
ncbi:UPF0688 protein C1orf174 homolog isoform X1 [Xyrichtys novacula]|uniref:UPF0688 protein C1orf174 homolog isoform X1 n=1 Tax=Xyrichtys novacula TaxID=13765 RepID=A0AAV1F3F1_XYRNO|nr:UPF0688 protein C1orf174 homolog isoform X1 [Xyrichtys novacula]